MMIFVNSSPMEDMDQVNLLEPIYNDYITIFDIITQMA